VVEKRGRRGWRWLLMRGDRLHPLWRAFIYLLLLLGTEIFGSLLLGLLYAIGLLLLGGPQKIGEALLGGGVPRTVFLGLGWWRLATGLGLALILGRFLDKEPAETMGLDRRRAGRDGLLGALFGLGTMGAIGGLLVALRWASPARGSAGPADLLLDMIALLPAAAAEEIAFRGYLQRAFGEWRGPVIGILVSSVIFALFHALNPHVNPMGLLNILLAGVVFAVSVERTGTLWLATGYHFLWNLTQGTILGMPVSGMDWQGLLDLSPRGPAIWTGGPFGPEGGLAATLVLLLSLIPLWLLTRRPATVAVACRNQRAGVEAAFGPLPAVHHRLDVGPRLFRDLAPAPTRGRMGEVVLLLRRADGKVLLHTKSFYPPGTYRLPSGGIRPGEGVTEAARREAAEETGLSAREPRPLGLLTYTLRDGRRRCFFHSWLVAADVEGEPNPGDGEEGIAGFRWVGPEELDRAAEALRALPPKWDGWGRFRALAHEAAARRLSTTQDARRRMQEEMDGDRVRADRRAEAGTTAGPPVRRGGDPTGGDGIRRA